MTSRMWGILAILSVVASSGVCTDVRAQFSPEAKTRGQRFPAPEAIARTPLDAGSADWTPPGLEMRSSERRSPEAALLMRADWDCDETPLDVWLRFVSQRCRIPVFLAAERLKDAGIDPATPVSLELGDVPLHVTLTRVLNDLGLDYAPEDVYILVSTTEELELRQSTRVYPVRDLVPGGDWESLMAAIQRSTHTMWEDVDGEGGTISPLPAAGSLVIRQNWKTHRQIRSLLMAVRQAGRLPDVPSIPATPFGTDDFEILPPVPLGRRGEAQPVPARSKAPAAAWQVPRKYDEEGPRIVKPQSPRPGTGFFSR